MRHVVDLFCGAGGTSTGILKAALRLDRQVKLTAVNHWQTAINSHTLNHPTITHLCEPVENIHPLDLVKSGRLHVLAASCECRFHSNARGGGPCNEQSRSQPWQLIRWASDIQVDNILMENVPEFVNWGPLNLRTKRPLKSRKGEYFKSFINALIGLGYNVEFKIQCAADYGDPTSRRRLMLIARRANGAITWPEPSHGAGRAEPHRTAREIIDWALKGESIFNRKKPLCANTLRRIAAGLQKFGGEAAEPFLVMLRGTSPSHIPASARSLDDPMPALTANGTHACLVEPFIYSANHGEDPKPRGTVERRVKSLDVPLPSLTTSGGFALCEPFIVPPEGFFRGNTAKSLDAPLITITGSRGRAIQLVEPILVQTDQTGGNGNYARSIDRPIGTVVSKQNTLLVEPLILKYYKTGRCKPLTEPLDTVTTRDRFMLVEAKSGRTVAELDIRTRMLQPHELAAAHSFPKSYRFTGNKEDQTKQIGNSVPVELAAAHAKVVLC